MNTKNIDSNIGMPDIDKEWKRFEKEVMQYKTKRAIWKLTGDNLLNVRQYIRTSFMDTDRFVHTTNLVGRTVMLTCKLLLAGNK